MRSIGAEVVKLAEQPSAQIQKERKTPAIPLKVKGSMRKGAERGKLGAEVSKRFGPAELSGGLEAKPGGAEAYAKGSVGRKAGQLYGKVSRELVPFKKKPSTGAKVGVKSSIGPVAMDLSRKYKNIARKGGRRGSTQAALTASLGKRTDLGVRGSVDDPEHGRKLGWQVSGLLTRRF